MPPPPKKKISAGPPAKRQAAPPLPCGKWIKVVEEAFDAGTFMLVTNGIFPGMVLGPRLDRGRGTYPECKIRDMTRIEAESAFRRWEAFIEMQQTKKKI